MEKENLQITAEVQKIFQNVRDICLKDIVEYFVCNTNCKINLGHKEEPNMYVINSTILAFVRDNKSLMLNFSELKGLDWMSNKLEYELYAYINNDTEEIIWYRQIIPFYHLELTGREKLRSLFPEPYIAKQGEVDEAKIYEYVHKYLEALKVMLAEPDFQKLLYDPEFWVRESPYK